MMRVLEKLWSEGKILAIGVSNFNLKQLVKNTGTTTITLIMLWIKNIFIGKGAGR
jgi:diketogulonate reductase-like aldo/keto reductase